MTTSDSVLYGVTDGVAELCFNRPAKKNAITAEMYTAMAGALESAAGDPSVRVVLVKAAGEAFTAGNDLGDFLNAPPSGSEAPVARFLRAISTFEKPLVAAVNGAAIGIGTTMLLHCDFVVASTSARFALPFVDLGLVPEAASSLLLPRLIGSHRAAQMLLLGDPIGAETAEKFGLVYRVVEPDRLAGVALELARRLAAKAPEALLITKRLLRADPAEVASRMAAEGVHFEQRLHSAEAKEAFEAFFAKRAPVFATPN